MTVQHDQTGTTHGSTGGDQSTAGRVADTAKSEASNVASTAAGGARDVAGEAGTQAKAVAGEAKQQLDRLMRQSRGEFRQQAEQRTAQAAGQLRNLSEQVSALVQGRPEAAGQLLGYANDAQQQLRRLAARMEQGGPQGVVDDVTRFARRRPGVFLAGAAGIGFVVGRLVRAAAASQGNGDQSAGDAYSAGTSGPSYEPAPLPPPVHSAGAVR
jgi:ElaB/YqjD/DUF883 family membrane-anchored ribosome-binding protein